MISDNEKLALLPIVFLAVLYFGRDILRFNKLNIKGFCKINYFTFAGSPLSLAILSNGK